MRVAVCDDDELEIAHLSELMKEYQLSRGVSVECYFFHNSIGLESVRNIALRYDGLFEARERGGFVCVRAFEPVIFEPNISVSEREKVEFPISNVYTGKEVDETVTKVA